MKKLLLVFLACLPYFSQAQLHLHNPSFEYPAGVSWIMYPPPEWNFCIGGKDGSRSACNVFDTSDLSKSYGSPSNLYYFILIGAKTYYNNAGEILYPDAYRATLSNSFICSTLLNDHKYQMNVDVSRYDNPPGDPYLNIFFGLGGCDTFSSVYGTFVSDKNWEQKKFFFIAKDNWTHLTLRCENKYLDSNIKELMEVSLKLDNLSPVTPDTAYNSEHFPIIVQAKGLGVYSLKSPYTGEQYWYEGSKLLGSGDSIELSVLKPTIYTLTLGKDSCIPSVLQTTIIPPGDTGNIEGLLFPNAFTPNGDARNALFRPIQNTKITGLQTYELSVYNRWGQRIWQTTDPTQGWTGADAGMGVYFWLCRYTLPNGSRQVQKGDVTLLK